MFWLVMAHVLGDYFLQSDWMALNKKDSLAVAAVHGASYGIPFAVMAWAGLFPLSILGLFVVVSTHILIDHYGLARYVAWGKNFLAPPQDWPLSFESCKATGYGPDRPIWLTVWLTIIVDNAMHLIINALASTYL